MTYEEVINNNDNLIHSVIRLYTDNQEKHEDYYQECLMKLWECFNDYDDRYEWSTYIYNVCSNKIKDLIKYESAKKRNNMVDDYILKIHYNVDLSNVKDDSKRVYSDREYNALKVAYKIINDDKYKDAVYDILNGDTYRETGDKYGVSKQYIHNRFKKIIKKIRKLG